MPDFNFTHAVRPEAEWRGTFRWFEGRNISDEARLNITFRTGFDGTEKFTAVNVSVLEWDSVSAELTFKYELDYDFFRDRTHEMVTLSEDDILEVSVDSVRPAASLDAFTELPSDITVSFDYVTARGTQKRLTGITPAFTRPSETHTGKTILVGFTEQENGSYARKTFRTDRITNLSRDNA
jgi:hypothetical protein